MKTIARLLAVVLLFLTAAVSGLGCAQEYQNRPSPAMAGTTDRWVDGANNFAYMRNINQRGVVDDAARLFYVDNPSRLSPWPIVDVSGNPR